MVGDVDETDCEPEWLEEPLLNWKTRDCECVELSILLRAGVGAVDVGSLSPKIPFRLLERCAPFVIEATPSDFGEMAVDALYMFAWLMGAAVLFCWPYAVETTDALFVLASGPLSTS